MHIYENIDYYVPDASSWLAGIQPLCSRCLGQLGSAAACRGGEWIQSETEDFFTLLPSRGTV